MQFNHFIRVIFKISRLVVYLRSPRYLQLCLSNKLFPIDYSHTPSWNLALIAQECFRQVFTINRYRCRFLEAGLISYRIFMRNYKPMQNIWNKLEKSSKSGQDKKSLISTFACFLTSTAKV